MHPSPSPHHPRKRFGQNFLHDQGVIRQIITSISPQESDCLVEIGPGQGAITFELLRIAKRMHAVELDRDLIAPLAHAAQDLGDLTIHNSDALRFDFRSLVAAHGGLRLVGNLPYNISTPILFHLLDQLESIRDMHFMLQKEVVDRMAAPPGSKTYGRLSVMVQVKCRVRPLFDIGPGAFRPSPKVTSSFVRLLPRPDPPEIKDFPQFAKLVAQAFSQRRKTLRNSLKNIVDTDAYQAANIDPSSRPEQLSVEDFIALSHQADTPTQPL